MSLKWKNYLLWKTMKMFLIIENQVLLLFIQKLLFCFQFFSYDLWRLSVKKNFSKYKCFSYLINSVVLTVWSGLLPFNRRWCVFYFCFVLHRSISSHACVFCKVSLWLSQYIILHCFLNNEKRNITFLTWFRSRFKIKEIVTLWSMIIYLLSSSVI